MRRWGRSIAVVVPAGVVTAFVLYGVTSWTPYSRIPRDRRRRATRRRIQASTHGRVSPTDGSSTSHPSTGSATRIAQEPEDDMIDRRAVPIPVGFALTVFIALIWHTARSTTEADRPSATEPGGHEPVAADGERG